MCSEPTASASVSFPDFFCMYNCIQLEKYCNLQKVIGYPDLCSCLDRGPEKFLEYTSYLDRSN